MKLAAAAMVMILLIFTSPLVQSQAAEVQIQAPREQSSGTSSQILMILGSTLWAILCGPATGICGGTCGSAIGLFTAVLNALYTTCFGVVDFACATIVGLLNALCTSICAPAVGCCGGFWNLGNSAWNLINSGCGIIWSMVDLVCASCVGGVWNLGNSAWNLINSLCGSICGMGVVDIFWSLVGLVSLLYSSALGAVYSCMDIPLILVWMIAFVIGGLIMFVAFVLGEIVLCSCISIESLWLFLVKTLCGGIGSLVCGICMLCPIVSPICGAIATAVYAIWLIGFGAIRIVEWLILGMEDFICAVITPFAFLISPRGGIFMASAEVALLLRLIPNLFSFVVIAGMHYMGMSLTGASSWCGGVQGFVQFVLILVSIIFEAFYTVLDGVCFICLGGTALSLCVIGVIATLYDGCMEVIKILDVA